MCIVKTVFKRLYTHRTYSTYLYKYRIDYEQNMNSTSEATASLRTNDGGVILSLFLMAASITYAMYTSITVYVNNINKVKDSNETTTQTLVRILSAWSNIGNSAIHVLLIVYIKTNEGNTSAFWEMERELDVDGIEGPLGLAILNFAAGMCSMHYRSCYYIPLAWNSFIIMAGTFVPIVWLRFIEEGLSSWPYAIVFIWFMIFAMELSAFSTSLTYYLLLQAGPKDTKAKKDD